ncbi:hypothetical protein KCU65_g5949, partial [Aureobasidium melanogenum]
MSGRQSHTIHWVVPTTLCTSFVTGVAFAVGHHCFYTRLDNQPVDDATLNQQYNTAVGTAFAFLARAALVIAITATYWQVFYAKLHHGLTISTIDSLAGFLSNLKELTSINAGKTSPLLLTLALLAWLVPVAVIFPPATLTVVTTNATNTHGHVLQTPNYTNADAFATVFTYEFPGGISATAPAHMAAVWNGPTSRLRRNLASVAYQGEIPSLQALATNSSYDIQFFGPAVTCQDLAPGPVIVNLTNALVDKCTEPLTGCANDGWEYTSYFYVAWTPSDAIVPYEKNSTTDPFPITATLGAETNGVVELFIASRPSLASQAWSVVNCSLHNASYTVSLTFEDGRQSANISTPKLLNPVLRPSDRLVIPTDRFGLTNSGTRSYLAVMDLLGDMLAGSMYYTPGDGMSTPSYNTNNHTRVLDTNLAFTKELNPIYVVFSKEESIPQSTLPSLGPTIEELVRNMTFSILNIPELLAPQLGKTDVFITTYFNIYNYHWQRLVLAYGLAISVTLITVILGLYTIIDTGSSYSNKFSTILRVSRDEGLDVLIAERDRRGEDPLPKHIGKAKFVAIHHDDGAELFMMGSRDESTEYHVMKEGSQHLVHRVSVQG